MIALDLEGIAVSVGSACSSGTVSPSPSLMALGLSRVEAMRVVRFSLARTTTDSEISRVLEVLPGVVARVRDAVGRRRERTRARRDASVRDAASCRGALDRRVRALPRAVPLRRGSVRRQGVEEAAVLEVPIDLRGHQHALLRVAASRPPDRPGRDEDTEGKRKRKRKRKRNRKPGARAAASRGPLAGPRADAHPAPPRRRRS